MRDPSELREDQSAKTRLGLWVCGGLVLLTLIEYQIAVSVASNVTFLIPFVVLKGGLILWYFMHIGELWNGGEH